jgi:mannitol-1-phosphate 5-dehydrogenase
MADSSDHFVHGTGKRTFVGFGFGPIQAGLFLYEAYRSRNFDRLVVAEIVPELVSAVTRAGGQFGLNVAAAGGIAGHTVKGVELHNPREDAGREAIIDAISEATEIATALPSVAFFGKGDRGDVVDLLSAGLRRKSQRGLPAAVIYAAENHNHAAEILDGLLKPRLAGIPEGTWQSLNTVIGKMSGVATDPDQIRDQGLTPLTPGVARAFLVEEFNRILITRVVLPGLRRGITVFEEKDDLLPFEEAKLFGHNATHALIGYLLREDGCSWMADAAKRPELVSFARAAFLEESGAALCRKYCGVDPLFTKAGYQAFVDDLIERMLNPHLRDSVDRVTRDPRRKLGWDDRLIGTMRVVRSQGILPLRYAQGAAAALNLLAREEARPREAILADLWAGAPAEERSAVADMVLAAGRKETDI